MVERTPAAPSQICVVTPGWSPSLVCFVGRRGIAYLLNPIWVFEAPAWGWTGPNLTASEPCCSGLKLYFSAVTGRSADICLQRRDYELAFMGILGLIKLSQL